MLPCSRWVPCHPRLPTEQLRHGGCTRATALPTPVCACPGNGQQLPHAAPQPQDILSQFCGAAIQSPLAPCQTQALQSLGLLPSCPSGNGQDAPSGTGVPEEEGGATLHFNGPSHPPADPRLLAAVRVLLARGSEEQHVLAQLPSEHLGQWDACPVSREHEARVMKGLCGIIASYYKGMATTIQVRPVARAQGRAAPFVPVRRVALWLPLRLPCLLPPALLPP